MTLGIVNINSCVTSKLPIIKKKIVIINLVTDKFLLHIVNKHQCNMFTMCSFFNKIFTATGHNNKMSSKNSIGNIKFQSKLSIIVFQINSISLIESEEFRETSNVWTFTS